MFLKTNFSENVATSYNSSVRSYKVKVVQYRCFPKMF